MKWRIRFRDGIRGDFLFQAADRAEAEEKFAAFRPHEDKCGSHKPGFDLVEDTTTELADHWASQESLLQLLAERDATIARLKEQS